MAFTKWTRKRWYRAKHLSRLLSRMEYGFRTPPLVDEYHRLVDGLELWRPDPLSIHISNRRPPDDDGIPF